MMKLNSEGNFDPWVQPDYGCAADGSKVEPPNGYSIVNRAANLQAGDVPFDVYSGWLAPLSKPQNPSRCKYPDQRYDRIATSSGRWTTWARPQAQRMI